MAKPLKPLRIGVCPVCLDSFSTKRDVRVYCSVRCGEVGRGRCLPAPIPDRVCALLECDTLFRPRFDKQTCCCEKHGKLHCQRVGRAEGRYKPDTWSPRRMDADRRRRALKRGARTGEPVVFAEVAERDRWRCGLCHKRVSEDFAWPHPLSPSLDHVVPLSKGGAHEPANVQLAHLRCNTAKGNRGGGEQLLLIG